MRLMARLNAIVRCHLSKLSQRFGVGDPNGRRSSEWIVFWHARASDVYLATRTLGGAMKASIHERGRCHVRAPDATKWRSPGPAPPYSDEWSIDPAAAYSHPFSVIIPEPELRSADWTKHKDERTVWLPVEVGEAVEIALFLVRTEGDCGQTLVAAGWHTTILDATLADSRRLLVVAGKSMAHIERAEELDALRITMEKLSSAHGAPLANLRAVLTAVDDHGTRRLVEVAGRDDT